LASLSLVVVVILLAAACTNVDGTERTTPPILETTSSTGEAMSGAVEGTSATTTSLPEAVVPLTPLEDLALLVVEVDSGFASPVLVRADPAGGPDLVVEQPGRIVRADGGEHRVVLDITSDVLFDGEQGLLGLAFHPDFTRNALAYVNYVSRSRTTVIEEFTVVDGIFDVDTRRKILEIAQPAGNHNGGMIEFGPSGYLWIGMGDGGAADDRFGNGQRADTLLGSMLRIAVGVPGAAYAIPPDNPFADGVDGRPEVWAIGLRNPWRFALDGESLWIADVGQDEVEEIDLADANVGGLNYGWPIMEGDRCFRTAECTTSGLVAPVLVYEHDEGCSITGGAVYRGAAIPELDGQFFFSDYCTGFIRSYTPDSGSVDWTGSTGPIESVTAFGTGGDGEMYVVSHTGSLWRIEAER
jgi:glucose/arabinose dehydrogenase